MLGWKKIVSAIKLIIKLRDIMYWTIETMGFDDLQHYRDKLYLLNIDNRRYIRKKKKPMLQIISHLRVIYAWIIFLYY